MADSDQDIASEVRTLTSYGPGVISDSEMEDLVGIAKSEINTEVSNSIDDFYGNPVAERALFWLTCFFTKLKTGEYEGMAFAVSEIEVNQIPSGDEGKIWYRNFLRKSRQLSSRNSSYVASISRTQRSYSEQRDNGSE